jgi:predicted NBD/HSP70 family sugar kinase
MVTVLACGSNLRGWFGKVRSNIQQRQSEKDGMSASKKLGLRSTEIADRNFRVVLEAIRRHGPLTRLELGQRTGLSGPGITNILRRMSDGGLISSGRRKAATTGTSSTEFSLDPRGAYAIGIRVAGARSEAVLVDLSGTVHNRIQFRVGLSSTEAIEGVVWDLLDGAIESSRLLGVGLAIGAGCNAPHPNILIDGLKLPVFVERDCVASLLAERTLGTSLPDGGLVMIVIDEAVQAGLLVRGVPLAGVHRRAGSIGAMRTGPDHMRLDSVVGLAPLRRLLTDVEFDALLSGGDFPMSEALSAWIKSAASHLLDAVVAMAGFVAPGVILIGGDLPSHVVKALIDRLSIERRDTSVRPFSTPWMSPIRQSSFERGGIAVGAALLPFFDALLPSPTGA